jgi:hypothetical protein
MRLSAEVITPQFSVVGVTRDVSTGGVCVELDRLIADGELVDLKLFLVEDDIEAVDARALIIPARVQWSAEGDRSYAHGLRFESATPDKIAMLENALKVIAASQ